MIVKKGVSGVIKIGPDLYKNVKIDNMKFCDELGRGGFGKVSKGVLGKNVLAVKKIEFERQKEDFDMEKKAFICMELMATCLEKLYKNHLKPQKTTFPECILAKITISVVNGLRYLYDEHKIIHRDLKPNNVLVGHDGKFKLSDFGIAGKVIKSRSNSPKPQRCQIYCSPLNSIHAECDARSDIWSLGITLAELALQKHPYKTEYNNSCTFSSTMGILCQMSVGPPPPLPEMYSSEFHEFVYKCLEKDFFLRPEYRELSKSLWFQNYVVYDADLALWLHNVLEHSQQL
uniref:mitogen-activated protein kinase kinase n=1 Tax=Panagrolaimus davidi TaxID=227884 RepID=A0A914Q1V8_9BILA